MAWTGDLVEGRFDASEKYASEALDKAKEYMDQLENLLGSLELPSSPELEGITFPVISPIDYSAVPSFTQMLEDFPTFGNVAPEKPTLDTIPDIDVDFPQENFNFTEHSYPAPNINIDKPPEDNTDIKTVDIPDKPDIQIPDVPTLTDIDMPPAPNIDLPAFDAVSPTLTDIDKPAELNYTEGVYNSDIRVDLFGKILNDLKNGGTGLNVEVERELYDRGRERQRVENERLYNEVVDQFSAAGFSLPSGAYASRTLEVSNEISRKTDQINREITISQADLAQKNTQFTVEQARQIEGMLMEFFNQQETRSLDAAKGVAQNAVEIYNSVVTGQKLALEKYQTEAAVFEQKIRAELAAVEVYKAQMEGSKVKADVQESRIRAYGAQIGGLETIVKLYATEMESAKVNADVQKSKIEVFQAQTEAYAVKVGAEKARVDVFNAQIDSERSRAQIYSEKVKAYQSKIEAKRSQAETQSINAENILKTNQLRIDEYRAKLEGYRAELEAETKTAQLQVEGFRTEASAYEVRTNAKGMEYQTRMQEIQAQIEKTKGQIQKQISQISAAQEGYVALKSLQEKATEGMMNANAQLAASAMNAVNASASQDLSSRSSDSFSETHTYKHEA